MREFQRGNGLRADGVIGNGTRNGAQRPASQAGRAAVSRTIPRSSASSSTWSAGAGCRSDLGKLYVWDNVPEFLTRVVKDGKVIHTDKIIVGQPTWPTPSFSADMKTVVFHPSWGVPDGIKAKELAPLLRKSSGGGFFGIFGGGYSAEAVLEAYQLRAYVNGRQVDANSIDWSSVDMRSRQLPAAAGPEERARAT